MAPFQANPNHRQFVTSVGEFLKSSKSFNQHSLSIRGKKCGGDNIQLCLQHMRLCQVTEPLANGKDTITAMRTGAAEISAPPCKETLLLRVKLAWAREPGGQSFGMTGRSKK
jgi:hypothetical protein